MVAEEKDAIFVAPIIAMADRYTVHVTHELVHAPIPPRDHDASAHNETLDSRFNPRLTASHYRTRFNRVKLYRRFCLLL